MKLLVYSAKDFEIPFLEKANKGNHDMVLTSARLASDTAMKAIGHRVVSVFSADDASSNVLEKLRDFGVEYLVSRSTGYDNIHLKTARELEIKVAHSPAFSPNAVAEHAIALYLAFNRSIVAVSNRSREHKFSLSGMVGTDLSSRQVGVLGTGAIGTVLVKILNGFGCKVLANDLTANPLLEEHFNITYTSKAELLRESEVVFICLPLNSDTHKLFDRQLVAGMRQGAVLVNVARGAIVDTPAILEALDNGRLSGYATDVFDKEGGIFYLDHKEGELKNRDLLRLIDHPRVLLTPHQAFATREGLAGIARMLFKTLDHWERGEAAPNEL